MDDKTRDKLSEAIVKFLNDLIHIADEENYDRDSFVKASADMFQTMAAISTFRDFKKAKDDEENGKNACVD